MRGAAGVAAAAARAAARDARSNAVAKRMRAYVNAALVPQASKNLMRFAMTSTIHGVPFDSTDRGESHQPRAHTARPLDRVRRAPSRLKS
jgi:hypothetical protein